MVKALSFKGDKPLKKKRKRTADDNSTHESAPLTNTTTPHDEPPEDDNWVSADVLADIAGPVLIVLPTTAHTPISSLSVDAHGTVFAQKIENLVEASPTSAEPHDVRQVWIANRVVGMEKEVTFKGHHGRYLGCDGVGEVFARREAVGGEETWVLEEREGGAFALRVGGGGGGGGEGARYLGVQEKDKGGDAVLEVRGDGEAEEGDAGTTTMTTPVFIRMQARFKPRLKVEKAEKTRAKISRKEIEAEVGRRLEDAEVQKLKRARREGDYHEAMLDVKVKGKHDKFA